MSTYLEQQRQSPAERIGAIEAALLDSDGRDAYAISRELQDIIAHQSAAFRYYAVEERITDKRILGQMVFDVIRAQWLRITADNQSVVMPWMNPKMTELAHSLTDAVLENDLRDRKCHPLWLFTQELVACGARLLMRRTVGAGSSLPVKAITDIFRLNVMPGDEIGTLADLVGRFPQAEYGPTLIATLLSLEGTEKQARIDMIVHLFRSAVEHCQPSYVGDVMTLVEMLSLDKVLLLNTSIVQGYLPGSNVNWLSRMLVSDTIAPEIRELNIHAVVRGIEYPADTNWSEAAEVYRHTGTPELVEELYGAMRRGAAWRQL